MVDMIIWRGWGVLALLIAGLGGGGGTAIAGALGMDTSEPNVGTAFGLLLAAAAIWVVGARLNAPRPGFDTMTGERVVYRNVHTLMFIPMQWLAPVVGMIGLAILVLAAFR
jgi:hypothetical protein